jgi:hypothetical protein
MDSEGLIPYISNELLKKIPLLVNGKSFIKKMRFGGFVCSHEVINKHIIIIHSKKAFTDVDANSLSDSIKKTGSLTVCTLSI